MDLVGFFHWKIFIVLQKLVRLSSFIIKYIPLLTDTKIRKFNLQSPALLSSSLLGTVVGSQCNRLFYPAITGGKLKLESDRHYLGMLNAATAVFGELLCFESSLTGIFGPIMG